MHQLQSEVVFDLVRADEVPAAFDLETKGFPADEVTPFEQFVMRQERAPSLFLGAFAPSSTAKSRRILVGFACCTRSLSPIFTAETMKTHDPEGSSLCIQNVVVSPAYQRRGIALALVKQIIAKVRSDGLTKRFLLICRDYLRPLYAKAGFEYVGVSPVVLGARPWDEMRLVLKEWSPNNVGSNSINGTANKSSYEPSSHPTNLVGSLQQSNKSVEFPSPRLLSSFPGGLSEVTMDSKGVKHNKYDILCPRIGCGCTFLKSGVGHLVEKEIPELKLVEQPSASLLASLPSTNTKVPCWIAEPNPMVSQNIGFSHSVHQGSGSQGGRIDSNESLMQSLTLLTLAPHPMHKRSAAEDKAAELRRLRSRTSRLVR